MLFLSYKLNALMWWYIGSKAKIFRNLMCMLLTLHMSMVLLSLVSACDVLIYKFSDLTCGIGDVSKFSGRYNSKIGWSINHIRLWDKVTFRAWDWRIPFELCAWFGLCKSQWVRFTAELCCSFVFTDFQQGYGKILG